jgi:hypothetical protein
VEDIKIRRLGRAGHMVRTEDERIPKMVLNGRFHNTRPAGRDQEPDERVLFRGIHYRY